MPKPDRAVHLIVERGTTVLAHPLHEVTVDEVARIVERIGQYVPTDATWRVGRPG